MNPVRHAKAAITDLRTGTSTALVLGLAALLVASVALVVALRKD